MFAAAATASPLVPAYAADTDPESAKEMLAERMQAAQTTGTDALGGIEDPESADERRMRPTRAPEKGVDWMEEGARFARSGTFNTILRSVIGILTKRR